MTVSAWRFRLRSHRLLLSGVEAAEVAADRPRRKLTPGQAVAVVRVVPMNEGPCRLQRVRLTF